MRTALFMLGMLINSGLQTLAESNGYELKFSDSLTQFVGIVFVVFSIADIIEFLHNLSKGNKHA